MVWVKILKSAPKLHKKERRGSKFLNMLGQTRPPGVMECSRKDTGKNKIFT